ncbi:MAG: hypothetical protein JKY37_15040 [Nannocystaceae bacterium]|nr:hypothetical protein [Nannocystaceae bacterium]
MRATDVIVVRDDVPRARMWTLAREQQWPRTGQTDRGHLVVASEQWAPSSGLTVTWVEDHTSDVRSVRVTGSPDAVRPLAAEVRDALPHHPRATLIAAVQGEQRPATLIGLAGKLASCRPAQCDSAHLAAVQVLLAHEVLAVRRAALRNCYRYGWPQMQALVRTRYEEDDELGPQLDHLLTFLLRAPS